MAIAITLPLQKKDSRLERDMLLKTSEGINHNYRTYQELERDYDAWVKRKTFDYEGIMAECDYDPKKQFMTSAIAVENLRNPAMILDVCCGTGLAGIPFIKRDHKIDGVDISKAMLKEAQKKGYKRIAHANILYDSPFKNRRYDGAISAGAIGETVLLEVVIAFMLPRLKEKAMIAISANAKKTNKKDIINVLNDKGFCLKGLTEYCGYTQFNEQVPYLFGITYRGFEEKEKK